LRRDVGACFLLSCFTSPTHTFCSESAQSKVQLYVHIKELNRSGSDVCSEGERLLRKQREKCSAAQATFGHAGTSVARMGASTTAEARFNDGIWQMERNGSERAKLD
jgi:hypothetical protein